MRSINKVILIGNLTRDPEMRRTLGGQNITTFGIATNREWMTKDGRKEQATEFHDVVCWGRLAEIAQNYLKKGKLVHVEGFLKTRSWDDPSGVKKFRTEIVVEDLIILEKRPQSERSENGPPQKNSSDIPDDTMSGKDDELFQPQISIENPRTI